MFILSGEQAIEMSDSRKLTRTLRSLAIASAAILSGLGLAGCGTNRVTPTADMSNDGQTRHAIALAESTYSEDVFPVAERGRLDARSAGQLKTFAQRYREVGQGQMTMLVPQGGPAGVEASAAAPAMRAMLARAGIHDVLVAPYPVADPALAAPVRLTFTGIKAKLAHRCGDWPDDLASASNLSGWNNQTYWNFGCATQSMVASQVADPRDIAGPRGETPPDTAFRRRGIEAIRKGSDPSTTWRTQNSSIGAVGN